MGMDPRKRQKKLEKRKAKEKAKRRELARRESGGMPARMREAARAPILHTAVAEVLWEQGIGDVLISRELRNGNVAFAMFLLDVYCLGVKDVFIGVRPKAVYQADVYEKASEQYELAPMKPECVRKLIEGAVQYASDLGLAPHHDYRTAKLLFGDIDAAACSEEFEYGKDGKPFFFAGPHDDADRCRLILSALEAHCEPGGYHFLTPLGPSISHRRFLGEPEALEYDDDFDDGYDEEDYDEEDYDEEDYDEEEFEGEEEYPKKEDSEER